MKKDEFSHREKLTKRNTAGMEFGKVTTPRPANRITSHEAPVPGAEESASVQEGAEKPPHWRALNSIPDGPRPGRGPR